MNGALGITAPAGRGAGAASPQSPPRTAGRARRGRPTQPAGAAAPPNDGEKPTGAASHRLANRYRLGGRWQLGFRPNAKGKPRQMAQDRLQGKRSRQKPRGAGLR